MQRYLYIDPQTKIVVNVVGYVGTPPEFGDAGEYIVLDPTGFTNVGDSFDPAPTLKAAVVDGMDSIIFSELLRLTNELRAAQPALLPKAPLNIAEYKATLVSSAPIPVKEK